MELILILIGIILLEAGAIYIIIKIGSKKRANLEEENKRQEREINGLNTQLSLKDRSIDKMNEHAERIHLTKKELAPIKKEIQAAQTDEEAILAIGNIIKRNNKRI